QREQPRGPNGVDSRPGRGRDARAVHHHAESTMDNALDLLLGTYPSWSRLVVRLALGIVFFAHGSQKVFGWFGGHGLKATIQVFQQYMKVPPAAMVLAAFIECFGGLALIVGV